MRLRSTHAGLGAFLAVCALAGCDWREAPPAAPPPAPAPEPPPAYVLPALFAKSWVPMAAGERWIYAAHWNGIPVGTATIEAVEVRQVLGRKALHVRCTIQPNAAIQAVYHVKDEISTDIDLETGWPLRFAKHIEEGSRLKDEVIQFDHAGKTATYYRCKLDEGETVFTPVLVMPIPEGVQDPLSCLFQARAMPLQEGDEGVIRVNTDERTYDTRLKVLKHLPVYLANFGDLKAILLDPRLDYEGIFPSKGSLKLWVEEETRIPLKLEVQIKIGTVQGELVRREGGRGTFKRVPKIPDSERIRVGKPAPGR